MSTRNVIRRATVCGLAAWATLASQAQPGSIAFETVPYVVNSGVHDSDTAADSSPAFSHTITMPGLSLLRVRFGEYYLGSRSYVTITSREDGGWQTLDGVSMQSWSRSSAAFNGDTVDVELFVGADDHDVYVEIVGVTVPVYVDPSVSGGTPRTLCDFDDDRVPSSDPRVGRLNFGTCTPWLTLSTAFLTAGHCTVSSGDIVEFNIPQSSSNGMSRAASPDDQYPVLAGTISSQNTGIGEDWAVFGVGANSNTGLTPWQAQGSFFRLTRQTPGLGDTVRVTGCGVDHTPAGPGGFCCHTVDGQCVWNDCNSRNVTLQTDTGYFGAGTGTSHMYRVDTEPANSGSPIIWEANGRAIGVHTTGSCTPFSGNQGTSFENTGLINALENFLSSDGVFADAASLGNSGSVFSPYRNVLSASLSAPNGATINFVVGSYPGPATFSRPATLRAPIGIAALGR